MIKVNTEEIEKNDVDLTKEKGFWKKFLIFLTLSIVIDLIIHILSPFELFAVLELNIVTEKLGVPVIAGIYIFIHFGILAFIFVKIQDKLQGKKIQKGLGYGISVGGFFFIGMLEVVILWDSPFWAEIYMGLADCIPLIILGFLLGKYIAKDSNFKRNEEKTLIRKKNLVDISIITTMYLIGRYFQYYVIQIENVSNSKPGWTFLWTLGIGLWISLSFIFLSPKLKNSSPVKIAVWFGIFIFGINWILYHLFMPALFDMPILPTLIRALVDTISVIIAIYITEKIKSKL